MSLISECVRENKSPQGRYLNKHTHFVQIYENLLAPYVGKEVFLAELGINHGGSLQLWRDYLGEKSYIFGMDNAEHCLYNEDRITSFLIDQHSDDDLKKIGQLIPRIDIFIDDGSHYSEDQIMTFEEVFSYVSHGGLYIVEDTHTSYRDLYDGGHLRNGTFIEYCKNIVDSMYSNEADSIRPNTHISSIDSITFYYAMVVVRKK